MNVEEVGLILLAAGRSSRFGAADKLIAPLQGQPLARHAAGTLSGIGFGHRIAVCSEALPIDWAGLGFEPIAVEKGQGLSASIVAGIARLRTTTCAACLIALADMPFVEKSHFEALVAHEPVPVLATGHEGQAMVPALFARDQWARLAALSGDAGARALLKDAPMVEAPSPWLVDIDTVADLARFTPPAGGR